MNSNWSYSPETSNLGQIRRFLEPCALEIGRMTLKKIGHLFYATSSFVHHFVPKLVNSNLSYSPETLNSGQNRRFLEPCHLVIWRMTLKNNRAPLLCYFKLCAAFRSHWWIQTGVTVRKRPIWVKFDDFRAVWPWNLTDHLEKQWGTSSMLFQALCSIS